jgi:hypothetical protein
MLFYCDGIKIPQDYSNNKCYKQPILACSASQRQKGKTFRPQRNVPDAAAKGAGGRIMKTVQVRHNAAAKQQAAQQQQQQQAPAAEMARACCNVDATRQQQQVRCYKQPISRRLPQ